jgi:cobalt-zinc-cadmium efflux system outer membrane protein
MKTSGRFLPLLTVMLIGVFSTPVSAAENASPWEELVREAYSHSPELRAAHARWQASAARPAQALSLPDPTVSYGYFVQRMETRQRFSIQQMFPGGGRRGLEAEAAIQAAHGVEAELEATAARVRTEVLKALAEWHLVRQNHALIAQNLDLVVSLEAVATQRYRAGEASQADVLRLQSEADILRADLAEWEDRRAPVLARLNARLGRPVDSSADAALETLTALPPLPVSASWPDFASLINANPVLRESHHLVRQAEFQREISRRASRPDFMVGLELMDNRGMARDEVVGMVGVNLPVWRTRTAALRREANANLQAAEHNYTARRLSLEADARQLLFALSAANRRIQLYDDALIPRARRTLALIEGDYRTSRAGFLDLLEARRTLLALEQAVLNARVERFGLGAEWEQLAGPFFTRSTTTPSPDE